MPTTCLGLHNTYLCYNVCGTVLLLILPTSSGTRFKHLYMLLSTIPDGIVQLDLSMSASVLTTPLDESTM